MDWDFLGAVIEAIDLDLAAVLRGRLRCDRSRGFLGGGGPTEASYPQISKKRRELRAKSPEAACCWAIATNSGGTT